MPTSFSKGFRTTSSGVFLDAPTADGTAGQVIKTDGAGQLAFVDQSSDGSQGAVQFSDGSGGFSSSESNLFWNSTKTRLELESQAISGRETVLRGKVSDAANDAIEIANGTSVDGRFSPILSGYVDSHDTTFSIAFRGFVDDASDVSDSSDFGIVHFACVRTDSPSDPNNGTLADVVNRKLYTFGGKGTDIKMAIAANGDVGVNNVSAIAKFDVRADATPSGLSFAATDSAGSVLFAVEADGDIRTAKSEGGTTLGSVVRRLALRRADGTFVGYFAIYDDIT